MSRLDGPALCPALECWPPGEAELLAGWLAGLRAVCAAESGPQDEESVRLLVMALRRHGGGGLAPVCLIERSAEPKWAMAAWRGQEHPALAFVATDTCAAAPACGLPVPFSGRRDGMSTS